MADTGTPKSSNARSGVFISYARSDGEAFATRLRALLEAEGLSLWQDRARMEGGRDWWLQITGALGAVEFMVLVMTPEALRSEMVRREWRHARREGVCVYPVKGAPGLDFGLVSRWMRALHWYDIGTLEGGRRGPEWPTFLDALRAKCETPRVPFMVEDLPGDFVARPAEFDKLSALFLDRERDEPIAVTAALKGAGGYGKTTLARALCHSREIQEAFDEGILWVTLGEPPRDPATGLPKDINLTGRVEDLVQTLSGERPGFASVEAATARLVELLADRDLLIVIDDVWNGAHLKPFTEGGPRCARLITTRDLDTLPPETPTVDLGAMRQEEAVALLGAGLPEGQEDDLCALAGRLGEWPLLLTLVNGTLRRRHRLGQPLADAFAYVNEALDRRGLTAFDARNPEARAQAVAMTLGVSFEQLSADEDARCGELAVFPEDVDVPLPTLTKLWGATGDFGDFETEELCGRLYSLSLLLRYDFNAHTVRLHDVVRAYLVRRQGDKLGALHEQLLDAHRPQPPGAHGPPAPPATVTRWADLPRAEPYLWDHLAYHLGESARADELLATAKDLGYVATKTFLRKSTAVEADLLAAEDLRPADAELGALRRAFTRIAHLLNRCETLDDLKANLYGRLCLLDALAALTERFAHALKTPYLAPFRPLPDTPHPALVRTLGRHPESVNDCAFGPDGSFVVSASDDGTLKVWDANSGKELRTLGGHAGRVNACDVSPDGALVVSASDDGTLKVWDVKGGAEALTIDGRHEAAVNDCAFSPDGAFIVSASFDRTVRVWDAATGRERLRLEGHARNISSCAVGPGGTFIVSASYDGVIKVWDAGTGAERLTIDWQAGTRACAVSPDGSLIAAAGSYPYSVGVWDAETGDRLFELAGHTGTVTDCAFGPDGTFIVSASDDGALKVWDVGEARERATLAGHTAWVSCCAVSRDGRLILSGDNEGGLKLWDARGSGGFQPYLGHWSFQPSCGVSRDGSLAAYTSGGVLHVYDVSAGRPLRAPSRMGEDWFGCAVSPDGTLVATVAEDSTVLWDTGDGDKQRTLWETDSQLYCCGFSPDGALLVTGASDGGMRFWDPLTGKKRLYLSGHTKAVYDFAFSPDGSFVVSASDDGALKVWGVPGGEELLTLAGHARPVLGCAVSADGALVASASADGTAKVWDAQSGAGLASLGGHQSQVTGCAFSPDADLLVTSSRDMTLKVWELATGECLHTFQAEGKLEGCEFFGDGERLAAVGEGGLYLLRLVRRVGLNE